MHILYSECISSLFVRPKTIQCRNIKSKIEYNHCGWFYNAATADVRWCHKVYSQGSRRTICRIWRAWAETIDSWRYWSYSGRQSRSVQVRAQENRICRRHGKHIYHRYKCVCQVSRYYFKNRFSIQGDYPRNSTWRAG